MNETLIERTAFPGMRGLRGDKLFCMRCAAGTSLNVVERIACAPASKIDTRTWNDVGSRLDKAIEAYNKSVAILESRVLVSVHRQRDVRAGAEDVEIEAIEPVERTARALQRWLFRRYHQKKYKKCCLPKEEGETG